jgi:very-short-patch-repair endonuclease
MRSSRATAPAGALPAWRRSWATFWPRERLAVELDSYRFHRGPAAFKRDRDKDLLLRDARIESMRFTGDHLRKQPVMVVARIATALARLASAD